MTKGTTNKKSKGGRPTDYRGAVTCRLVETTPLPATVAQLCDHLGQGRSTLYDWMEEHPEFSDAVTRRRAQADDIVENSLYKRANGYDYVEVMSRTEDGGKDGVKNVSGETVKHVVPDPGAQMNWLKNRRPEKWREKSEVEITGNLAEQVKQAALNLGLVDEGE